LALRHRRSHTLKPEGTKLGGSRPEWRLSGRVDGAGNDEGGREAPIRSFGPPPPADRKRPFAERGASRLILTSTSLCRRFLRDEKIGVDRHLLGNLREAPVSAAKRWRSR